MRARSIRAVCLWLAFIAGAGGCSALGRRKDGGPVPQVAGVWEGVARTTLTEGLGAGDTRVERQAWKIEQKGRALTGFYVIELTMISGDGRPYLCSQTPRFDTLLRFEVRGQAGPGGIELQEIGDVLAKGPCRPSYHTPVRFKAELAGNVLTLLGGEQKFSLYRRPEGEQAAATAALLAFQAPDSTWTGEPSFPSLGAGLGGGGLAEADVQGLWVWEHHGTVPGGDEKHEREEWHLSQTGTRIDGYYDRSVRQISTDGNAYRCSNSIDFRVVTRYQVSGEVRGNRLVLFEKTFEVLEGSPCDNGQRRLDAYQGEASGGEIRLVWGVGQQVLRRARPSVPSQKF